MRRIIIQISPLVCCNNRIIKINKSTKIFWGKKHTINYLLSSLFSFSFLVWGVSLSTIFFLILYNFFIYVLLFKTSIIFNNEQYLKKQNNEQRLYIKANGYDEW